jgi:hypothetical protein
MGEDEIKALADDIKANGLRESITLFEGAILDGRNRYLACKQAGVEGRFEEFDGQSSPVAFVASRNLHRRHLTESQRAMVGARIKPLFEEEKRKRQKEMAGTRPNQNQDLEANLPQGRERAPQSRDEAAKVVNVGPRTVDSAARVLNKGVKGLAEKVDCGEVSVTAAAAVATLPAEKQEEIVAGGPDQIKAAAAKIRGTARPKKKTSPVPVRRRLVSTMRRKAN